MRRALHLCRAIGLILLANPFVLATVYAQGKSDEAAVRNVPRVFAAGWAKHDGNLLAKTMAADVDFVNIGGDWLHGRENFALYHSRLLSGRFKESVLTPLDISVRFLQPRIAILHWSWRIEGDRNEDSTLRKPRFGLFTMVVEKRAGEWLVVAAQNTNQMAGPNPELNGIKTPIVYPESQ